MANPRKVACGISMGKFHLTSAHSKGKTQGHAHLDCEYLASDDRAKYQLSANIKLHTIFRLAYLHWTVVYSKGKGQGQANFNSEYF